MVSLPEMQMQHRPRLLLRLSAGLIHPPSQPEDDVEVRLEDQKAINTFGRLNTRLHELTEEIKEKRSLHDQLDDAANELILADDDEPVRCDPRLPLARCA